MKKSNVVAALLAGILLGGMVIGCKNDSPVGPQDNPVTASGPQFIKLPKVHSLGKILATTTVITPEHGGRLVLNFRSDVDGHHWTHDQGTQDLEVKMSLTFPPHSVTDTLVATMSLDDQVLLSNVTFAPHGSVFLMPALLDVDARGIDLTGLKPTDRVYLWYKDNGTWIKMKSKSVKIYIKEQRLVCQDGELPHFSAYAFGR
jgi:hypothetical protein